MKKNWYWKIALLSLLFVSDAVSAQSLIDIFKSSTVKDVVASVTGGKKLTVENLSGTWVYVNPAVSLEGDDVLKNVAGSLATSELEKKLKENCTKVGIVEGMFSYTFNADSTFNCNIKGRSLSGIYSLNAEDKTMTMSFGSKSGKLKLLKMNAAVVFMDNQLSLLFEADKLLDFISKLSSLSGSTTLQSISKLTEQYDGVKLGFDLKK
jgi:hypothetical protein